MQQIRGELPRAGDVLQIGEANWYGDVGADELQALAETEQERRILERAVASGSLFAVARAFYAVLFSPKRVDSVDFHGTETALRQDLNAPLQLGRQYDLSVNHGTAEHVFHIAQVFGTMHAWTKPGGLMIHESPWMGWPDHGFYTLQPTLFYDLAAANGYELLRMAITDLQTGQLRPVESRHHLQSLVRQRQLPENSILMVALRHAGGPFRIPLQGYYDGKLDADGVKNWQELR